MRRSKEETAQTRGRIVAEAARLFCEHGVDGVSVGDVMKAAELTHGGFYRHFRSKEELAVEAMASSFAENVADVGETFANLDEPSQRLEAYEAYYLSSDHLGNRGGGCPAAALAGEMGRADPAAKQEFGKGVRAMIGNLECGMSGVEAERRRKAMRTFAMQLGAVIAARASDPELAEELLEACRSPSP